MALSIDSASLARLSLVYPDLKTRVIRVINDVYNLHGLTMKVTEGIRTFERQKELYALGRSVPGKIVTRSRPGESIHHYGAACDLCFAGPDPYLGNLERAAREHLWAEYGRISHSHGLVWGGSFHDFDGPHIQITYGLDLPAIRKLYDFGGNPAVWSRFDQIRGVAIGSEWKMALMRDRVLNPQVPVSS